ncbi:MAG: hypothetical protein F9K22_00570 [Bacteroidetes bacterium]|nr:MAG: hypothetical protein F9K22_00570 [Bacteroidota bacterium]
MKRLRGIIAAVLLVSTATVAQFNSDFNITGAGARAEGFGGAFIGLADDATAVVWNPAGLSQLERPEASLVTRYISEGVKFSNELRPRLDYEESQGRFALNFASLAMPLGKSDMKLVAAVSYQKQLDFFDRSREKDEDGFGVEIEQESETDGGVNTITPAVALKITPVISVGLAVNIWTGTLETKDRLRYGFVGENRMEVTGDFSGLNFVIGGLVDFEQTSGALPLKLGVTLRTPFELKNDGSGKIDYELSGLSGDFEYTQTVQMPLMLGFGASYRIGENLTVAADYELRNYAQKKLTTEIAGSGQPADEAPVSESGKDLNEVRVGAEYLIVLETGVIPLRAGFKTVPTVLSDVDVAYDTVNDEFVITPTGTQVSGTGFSVGTGFITDRFAVDVTYGSQTYTQKFGNRASFDFSVGTVSSSVIIYF